MESSERMLIPMKTHLSLHKAVQLDQKMIYHNPFIMRRKMSHMALLCHGPEFFGTVEYVYAAVAAIALEVASNTGPRNEFHDLREKVCQCSCQCPEVIHLGTLLAKCRYEFKSTPNENAL